MNANKAIILIIITINIFACIDRDMPVFNTGLISFKLDNKFWL